MTRLLPLLFIFLLSLSLSPLVSCWGGEGHIATAWLAQSRFTSSATLLTSSLLPNVTGNISLIASWADQVRSRTHDPYYPWSAPWHYVDTPPYQCHYVEALDCPAEGCVDTAVRNYTSRSLTLSSQDVDQRREAMEFLVHYVGDLHQPLHAGFTTDAGGNSVFVTFNNGSSGNLHALWDSGLIDYQVRTNFNRSYPLWREHLNNTLAAMDPKAVQQWTTCNSSSQQGVGAEYVPCVAEWIQESSTLCCQTVYLDDAMEPMNTSRTFPLSLVYFQRNIDILEQRIMKAGVRMAFVINTIAAALQLQDSSSSTGAVAVSSSSSSSSAMMSSSADMMSSSAMSSPAMVSSTADASTAVGSSSSSSAAPMPTAESSSSYSTGSMTIAPTAPDTIPSSSTGSDDAADDGWSTSMLVAVAVVLLLLAAAAVVGCLYWRKRRYGLSGLCDSVDSQSSSTRARLLEEQQDTTDGYSRVV